MTQQSLPIDVARELRQRALTKTKTQPNVRWVVIKEIAVQSKNKLQVFADGRSLSHSTAAERPERISVAALCASISLAESIP